MENHDSFWRQPRTNNAFRNGLVVAQRFNPPAVRVQFPDRDAIQSYWLSIIARGSQNDKDYWMPDIGEQVCVLMDQNDENGGVLGTVWSTTDTVGTGTASNRFIQYSDGTLISYDRSTHAYVLSLGQVGSVTINTPSGNKINWDSSGNLNLTTGSGEVINCSQGGQAVSDALVLVSKFLTQFNSHIHSGISIGNDTTSPPVQQLVPTDVQSALVKVST
jgi:phage baseplate assembly protein V